MTNNAVIRGLRLKDLLEILDAKANVSFFTSETEAPVRDNIRVFRLLADEDFIETYGNYTVTGLNKVVNNLMILAKEA